MLRLLACLLLMPAAAAAGVYKCPTSNGGYEYRQIACDAEGSGAVQIQDPTVPLSRSRAESGEADASTLRGEWCEFAVAMTIDDEKSTERPATWNFGEDTVTYLMRGVELRPGQELPKMPLTREGKIFRVQHGYFGNGRPWTVVGRQDGAIVVEGSAMGFYFFRPGRC